MKNQTSPIGFVFIAAGLAIAQVAAGDDTVHVTGGTFLMGTKQSVMPKLKSKYEVYWPGVFENEVPAHEVTLSDFRIDKYEVTNEKFAQFLEAIPEWRKGNIGAGEHNGNYLSTWNDGDFPKGEDNRPVVYVTWAAAQSYCLWKNGRLPTEAEWEYVARSGDEREYPWGDQLPSPELANYYASDINATVDVGQYPANDFGVHDLAGNVWEFLLDVWVAEYSPESKSDPIAGGDVSADQIREIEGRRAVRGASFGGSVVNLRTRWRDSHVVTNAIEFVGFRCAYPQ